MTPLEETIQRLMEPDKHGEKGEPARTVYLGDTFTRPVQRTLDALWKFAEGVATASRDNMDHYDSAVARVAELEADNAEIPELLTIAHMQGAEHAKDRVKALEAFIYIWCDPCHMQEADLRFFNDICQRLEPATDRTKAPF